MRDPVQFPAAFLTHTGAILSQTRPFQGGFFDVTLLRAERGLFTLKAGRTTALKAELHQESLVLRALQNHAPFVPQPLACLEEEGLFLFTCVPGDNLVVRLERAGRAERLAYATRLGQTLRGLHTWRPPLPKVRDWSAPLLALLDRKQAAGELPETIEEGRLLAGQSTRAVLDGLKRWRQSLPPALAFTHGDFCLPNVLAEGDRITGVIDWSLGGYGDYRMDLAAGSWSIRFNLGDEAYVKRFLDAYGYTESPQSLAWFEALWGLA
jgi:kanamycin kinase